jgi:FAD:protein FMN transferase
MGNSFAISAVSDNDAAANLAIEAAIDEIRRIENLLSTYKEDSEINLINNNAGIQPIKASQETIALISRANRISEMTSGFFDISFGSVHKNLWNFNQEMKSLPTKEELADSIKLINYKNIIINHADKTVFLKEKGMRIGFGGIGKGYAAEQAKRIMKGMGIESGVVNASGDMTAWGNSTTQPGWRVGISHPDDKNKIVLSLSLKELCIATSGDYEKYILIDGKRYSHTINPKTGYPIQGIKSVSIISPNAELCDALTTPVMIMGKYQGIEFIDQIKDVEAVIIDSDNKIYLSKNLK